MKSLRLSTQKQACRFDGELEEYWDQVLELFTRQDIDIGGVMVKTVTDFAYLDASTKDSRRSAKEMRVLTIVTARRNWILSGHRDSLCKRKRGFTTRITSITFLYACDCWTDSRSAMEQADDLVMCWKSFLSKKSDNIPNTEIIYRRRRQDRSSKMPLQHLWPCYPAGATSWHIRSTARWIPTMLKASEGKTALNVVVSGGEGRQTAALWYNR